MPLFGNKEDAINAILLKQPVDLNALKDISRSKDGFVNNRLRTRVWPKLLNVNRYLIDDYRSYVDPHRDDSQVSCDVERSLWNFNHISQWKDSFRDKRRKALSDIIMAILCRNESLFYYQGFHDIVSIFLLVLEEDHLTFALCEATSLLYLSDYMQKDFEIVSKSMRMILILIGAVDRELYNYLARAKLEPFFATSWLITWFAHDIKNIDDIARIYDAFLCSHPLFSYYVCATYVISLRKHILKCECDFAALHNLLVHAPATFGFEFEKILPKADELFEKVPIARLKSLCDGELLHLIVNNKIICLSRPHWVMHKSRRVDSDLTLLQRLKIGGTSGGSAVGRFPIFTYYVNTLFASWGWKQKPVNESIRYLQSGDSNSDLTTLGSKGNGNNFLNSLFWSIAVLVSGILTYAIVTSPAVPPTV